MAEGNPDVEKSKLKKEYSEKRFVHEKEMEETRHKHIMEELELMGKHGVTSFDRRSAATLKKEKPKDKT